MPFDTLKPTKGFDDYFGDNNDAATAAYLDDLAERKAKATAKAAEWQARREAAVAKWEAERDSPPFSLSDTAYNNLQALFPTYGHHPSDQQWAAIRDLLDHLEKATTPEGLDKAMHVSTLPCGSGKSQSLASFARALLSRPDLMDTGMLILVNRIEEAHDMAREIGIQFRDRLCLYTSKHEANRELAQHEDADEAQLCIATQAALKMTLRALKGAPFNDAERFHYHGARRAVVCWDECLALNRPVTLDSDTVASLARAMRQQSGDAALTIKRWSCDLDVAPDGLVSVPDFEALGVDFDELDKDVFSNADDELIMLARVLRVISGDQGFVSRQGKQAVMISHYPEIPASIMPVIVTDASAAVNASYAQMAKRKVQINWLKDADKTYSNMTIRIVPTAASRSAYRGKGYKGRTLIELAAKYVSSVPAGERVLVIGYKGRFTMPGVRETTLINALKAQLQPKDRTEQRLGYLTYGHHTATNEYKTVKHVYLMGLNFVPRATSHASSGAAQDLNLIDEHPTDKDISDMRTGMLLDSTLQAVLRGNARNSVGGDCGECEVVIVQTRQTGLNGEQLHRIFPGARIVVDDKLLTQPVKAQPDRVDQLKAIVTRRLKAGDTEMSNPSLYREMGMDQRNFAPLVKRPEFIRFIQNEGLNPQPLKGRTMGLRLIA